ncbi:MAG TPA: hypothetical protein VHE10_01055 [Candidatus Paceibacterota bacterium]|nr:hypothetical protein [Candidatus Paceibacterota bacterium]
MKKIIYALALVSVLVPALAHAQQLQPVGQTPTQTLGNGSAGVGPGSQSAGNNSQSLGGSDAPSGLAALPNPLSGVNSISDLIYKVIQVVVDISYVVVAFFLLLSGFKFITAQGSDKKLDEAKSTFFYTIIGAALVIGAQVIVSILQGIFNGLNS